MRSCSSRGRRSRTARRTPTAPGARCPIAEWLRQNGWKIAELGPAREQLAVASPKKPPTSTPTQARPDSPRFCSWGMLIHRCSHQDELSPVQCSAGAAGRRSRRGVITNGRRSGRSRAQALARRPRHQRAVEVVDLRVQPRRRRRRGARRPRASSTGRGTNSVGSFMSHQTPATPGSSSAPCCPPHHRARARVGEVGERAQAGPDDVAVLAAAKGLQNRSCVAALA